MIFSDDKEGCGCFTISTIFLYRQTLLSRNCTFRKCLWLLVKEAAFSAERIPCQMYCILIVYNIFDHPEGFISVPDDPTANIDLSSKQCLDLQVVGISVFHKPFTGELLIVYIADNDVQISILGMVQIIDGTALEHVKFLTEL